MALELLSDVECKNATSEGKAVRKLSDGGGLYLWVYADGRKYWRIRYWMGGSEKSLSLGVYCGKDGKTVTTLKKARQQCREKQEQLGQKLDPSAERKADKLRQRQAAENSFEAIAREWFGKQRNAWAPHHADDVLRRLEKNIFPLIGRRPIGEIEAPELLEVARKIEARSAYDLAHRVMQMSGQVFRYGIATGKCTRDIAADLRGALTPHKKTHQAAVRPEELPELLREIAKYDEVGGKQTRLALQLLAITFVRTNELIGAEWVEFDLDNALWVIPAERMKMKTEHVVPLPRQALAKLAELKEIACGSRYILPGRNRDKPISNNTMLFALYRMGYKGKMTGHGFRSVASTILNESGFNPDAVERQLAHCERNEIRGAYNRAEYLPERSRMMQHWADYLDSIEAGAKVIPFMEKAAA